MKRRALLSAAGVGLAGLAGCVGSLSSDDGNGTNLNGTNGDETNGSTTNGTGERPPMYGEQPNNSEQSLRVDVTVVDGDAPQADQTVAYHDYGGSYDRLEGTTDADGELSFVDSMGSAPCNQVELEVPEHGTVVDAGCHNGGKEISETIDVGGGNHDLTLTLTVLDDGTPLAGTQVVFHDYGGTHDRLEGETDEDGVVTFTDSMGPSPCNPIEVEVPSRETTFDLGCHNGNKEIARAVDVAESA